MRRHFTRIALAAVLLTFVVTPATAALADPGAMVNVTIPSHRIPVENRYIPPHVGGDREYNGNGPNVYANANLVGVGTNRLSVVIYMDAIETRSDWTRARGTSPRYLIYVAPPGYCIRSVNVGTYEEIRYLDSDHGVDNFAAQVTGSFVRDWSFVGDTNGDEAGTRTGAALSTDSVVTNVQLC